MNELPAPPKPPPATRPPPPRPRRLDAGALLGDADEVEIAHEAEIYRLRRTRNGKLILTK